MPFDLQFYAVAAIVVTLTGVSKSGFSAGIEMLAVPVMALFVSPIVAAAIMLPILLSIDCANLWRYRRDWEKRIVKMLVPAAVIGIGVGAASFKVLSPELLRLGLGILTIAFVAHRLFLSFSGDEVPAQPAKIVKLFLGAVGGFTSFVAHAGGPPIKMLLLSENLSKQKFVGTNSYLFAIINLIKTVPYFFLGQFSAENLSMSLWLLPFVLIGVPLGFWLNGIVSQVLFTRVVLFALTLAAIKLVWDGLAYFQ